jgi:uncharacterized membrane protein YkvA (DUF1232 family)
MNHAHASNPMNMSTATVSLLQLPVSFGPARRNEIAGRSVRVEALVHFNALLRTIHAAAPRVDSDALISLARRMQTEPVEQTVDAVGERIARVQVLRRMLRDADWHVSPELRVRARLLLSYVDKHEDLIPDGTNLFGYLDDALMVELSWPRFEAEVGAYREFCAFRTEHPGPGAYAAWREQREEQALWQQHRAERRERGYAAAAPRPGDAMLRVC